ncbi:hypothetical protein C8R44DRAFT_200704 [Mycena epipterygia]|nr:hypothetical protein C8R44DRAFT_200704 [Mycena epipterygia]
MFSFTSLLAVAVAITSAVAYPTATAVEYTVGDTSSLACLGSGVSAARINIVNNAIASGTYVVVPDLPLANCGSLVSYLNSDVSTSVAFDAYAIGAATDANLGLGPTAFAESSNGAVSFNSIYSVSPTGGRRV